uniref:ATP synthase subunit a n=1 Tax=Curculionoidea sp. 31 KM-2017 TaxID=2219416 RepID=A0A346RJC7_9CUCU|nr:ATP synthase F0 subunit 6 [Curculionoidea sp. 31 KM-2017]
MMMNLFSSFDPTTKILSLNWTSSLIIFLSMPSMFWLTPSRMQMLWSKISIILHKEFKILVKTPPFKGMTILFCSMFTIIMLNNFMGLFPYIFTSSSHLSFTFSLSIPFWTAFMLFGWLNHTIHMFSHLVPQGAPNLLLPFLVIIESISNLIRPGTLAIRLTANMIAGHLLISLLSNSGTSLPTNLISFLIITQIALLSLETAVAIIQSYVFSILSCLYSSETN